MKRILAIAIALLMLCGSILPVSAEFYSVNDTWSSSGWSGLDINTELCPGRTVLSKTYTKPLYATWGYPGGTNKADYDQITFNYVFATAYNLSDMIYASLEVYASDKSVFDHRFILELTSSGKNNEAGIKFANPLTNYVTDQDDNWYLIEIPLSDFKTAITTGWNRTACNYMRMYYDDGFGTPFAVGDGFTFGIRNLGFSQEHAYRRNESKHLKINIWEAEIDTWLAETTKGTYWTNEFWGATNTALCPGETIYAKALTKPFLASWGTGYDNKVHMVPRFTCKFANAYDISEMKYLVWDFYATNASVLDCWFTVDLSSAKSQSDEISRARVQLSKYATGMGNGWYKIELPLEILKATGNKTQVDKTKCNSLFISFDNAEAYTYEGNFTFGIRSLGFSDVKYAEVEETASATMAGASVRCKEPTGLRFYARFNKTDARLRGAGTAEANFGVILISEARYAANLGMTFEELVVAGIKVPASAVDESEEGIIGVYAVVAEITEDHFTDNIVAIPYIENELVGAPQKRSLYGVAKRVVADPEALAWHQEFCRTEIIDKVEQN